jgi:hypothetical protein
MIEIDNSVGVEKGVKEIKVDGIIIPGNMLPLTEKAVCKVKVIMG